MIEMYMEEAEAPGFLSGLFRTPPENIHSQEMVEIDVVREDEEVAIVLQNMATGARENIGTKYTNKGFIPPIVDEKVSLDAYQLMGREPGTLKFDDIDFAARATKKVFQNLRRVERKIRRTVEQMASQVFATGQLSMKDEAGTALYTLDFQPKATHFITVGTSWATTGEPLADIESMMHVVRRDGKKRADKLIFGAVALQHFLANNNVKDRLKRDGLGLGQLEPKTVGEGATFYGWVQIGAAMVEIWVYDATYKDPATGNSTPYVADDHVLVVATAGRRDISFGAIPLVASPDPRAMAFLPPRLSSSENGIDLSLNAWISEDSKSLSASAGTRPLAIPTAIDTFGRLKVIP